MITAETLKARRTRLDLSQTKLAELAGLTHETISRYENEKVKIPLRTQLALNSILTEKEAG